MSRGMYSFAYWVLRPITALLYPFKALGRERVPEGAAIVCANHSHAIDPILLAFALGYRQWLHFMAKKELFAKPFLGGVLRRAGSFPVDRGGSDIGAIRSALAFLRSGEKIMIFPEGTRVSESDAVAAKGGAVRLAAKTGAPILPVYIPREKRLLRRFRVRIGEPYVIDARKLTSEKCAELSSELMRRIDELGGESL